MQLRRKRAEPSSVAGMNGRWPPRSNRYGQAGHQFRRKISLLNLTAVVPPRDNAVQKVIGTFKFGEHPSAAKGQYDQNND